MGIIRKYSEAKRNNKWYNKLFLINNQDRLNDLTPENKPAFDRWTIRHLLAFIPVGLLFPNKSQEILVVSVFLEALEEVLAQMNPDLYHMHEGIDNKVVDIIFNQLGYEIGSRIRRD